MPEFANAFSGLKADRKLTHAELVRSIRYMIAAEYEAVQLYMQLAESIDNEMAIAVLKDIAEEEIVHAGEFLRLLKEIAPDEASFYAEGEEEVEEMIAALKQGKNPEEAVETKDIEEEAKEEKKETAANSESTLPTVGSLFGR